MKKFILMAMVLFSFILFTRSIIHTSELPDFSSWTVIHSGKEDYNKDGADDVVFKFLSEHPNLKESLASAILYYFQPFDSRRIDMMIMLRFSRTSERGKDTILSIQISFHAFGENVEEKTIHRPKEVREVIREPMFQENSSFGKLYFKKWREFGLTDDEIRQKLPKWGWLPE